MTEMEKRLFVGIKVSTELQKELDSPAPGTDRYFKADNLDYLEIINLGEQKLIGRYLKDGFPVADIENVSRNICSILRLITHGRKIQKNSVHIYVS